MNVIISAKQIEQIVTIVQNLLQLLLSIKKQKKNDNK